MMFLVISGGIVIGLVAVLVVIGGAKLSQMEDRESPSEAGFWGRR